MGGELILHRWPGAWGLPSISPECTAVEAYLRLAGCRFETEDCKTPYSSPSGQLPALDQSAEIVGGAVEEVKDPSTAAYRITYHLQHKVADLDARLSSEDRALLIALLGLVESRLAAATNYFTWVDRGMFSEHTRHAYGAAFPAPLSYILPWFWRRRMVSRMPGFDGERAITGAADAYAALASHLSSRTAGKFFFGDKPTSLDAAAFAHLSYHMQAPVGDAMRTELSRYPVLADYVQRVKSAAFAHDPALTARLDPSQWLEPEGSSARRRGWKDEGQRKKPRTAKEIRFRQRSRYAVLFALGAVAAYLLLGEVVLIMFSDEEGGGGDEEEEEDED